MTRPNRRFSLRATGTRCAELRVREPGPIRMTRGEREPHLRGRVYDLRIAAQPWLRVTVPNIIDDDDLAFAPSEPAALTQAEVPLPEGLQAFLGRHGGPSTAALLTSLPAGDYFLIRSPLEATRPRFLCVGNDHIPATENVRCLTYIESAPDRRGREFRLMAYVLGSSPTSAPVLSGSMLGVTMTRYDGRHQSFGLVFLPVGTVDEGAPTDDRLLVMPRRGELVIDVKFDFAQKFPERYPDEWCTTYAPRAARILAGIGPG